MTIISLEQARAELALAAIESSRHPLQQTTVLMKHAEIESAMHAIDIFLNEPSIPKAHTKEST